MATYRNNPPFVYLLVQGHWQENMLNVTILPQNTMPLVNIEICTIPHGTDIIFCYHKITRNNVRRLEKKKDGQWKSEKYVNICRGKSSQMLLNSTNLIISARVLTIKSRTKSRDAFLGSRILAHCLFPVRDEIAESLDFTEKRIHSEPSLQYYVDRYVHDEWKGNIESRIENASLSRDEQR